MKVINKPLHDMEGNPIMGANDVHVTVAHVLMNTAITQLQVDPASGEKLPENAEQMDDYLFGIEMMKLSANETFDLDVDRLAKLIKKMPKMYPALIAGQVRAIIEGKA